MTSASCLVLGGAGFIGRALVEKLARDGWRVRVLDRVAPAKPTAGVDYRIGSSDDEPVLRDALGKADVCFHLVSTTLPASSNKMILYDLDTNLRNSVRLMETCVELGVKKLVYLSSGGTVYGVGAGSKTSEDTPLRPICAYGVTKSSVELYLGLFRHLHGLDYRVARLSNPYGPGQSAQGAQGAVAVFMDKIAKGEVVEIWGDGSVVRDFVYIDDVISAIVELGENFSQKTERSVFNVGSGLGVSLRELIRLIETAVGLKANIRFQPPRGVDVPLNILDCAAIHQAIGWRATTSIELGLKLTWDVYCQDRQGRSSH